MANASLKLIYFDFRGRAEASRLLMHAAGKDFEDKRIQYKSPEWFAFKPSTPFGQIPVLDVDGKLYAQMHAINRFLADELGLGGKTRLESLSCDQIILLWEDLHDKCIRGILEQDEAKTKEIQEEVKSGYGRTLQGLFEAMLKQTGTGYFVADRLTVGDIYVFDMHTGTLGDYLAPPNDADFPLLKANLEMVQKLPRISSYMAVRR